MQDEGAMGVLGERCASVGSNGEHGRNKTNESGLRPCVPKHPRQTTGSDAQVKLFTSLIQPPERGYHPERRKRVRRAVRSSAFDAKDGMEGSESDERPSLEVTPKVAGDWQGFPGKTMPGTRRGRLVLPSQPFSPPCPTPPSRGPPSPHPLLQKCNDI